MTAARKMRFPAYPTAVGCVDSALAHPLRERARGDARPLGSAPLETAMASGCLAVGGSKASASGHVSVARVGKAGCLPVGKNSHPRRDAKNANADRPVTLHAKFISSHGWLAQGKLMAPTFLVAIDQGGE